MLARKRIHVKKPKQIGPLIRNLTKDSVSIVLYGHGKSKHISYGVVYIVEMDLTIVKPLNKVNFYCERFEINDLESDKTYTYLCGIFHLKHPYNDDPLTYRKSFYNYFKTPKESSSTYTFAFGSCRFFLNFFGYGVTAGLSDKPFKTLNKLLDKGYPIESMFMIGDSIYMDVVKWLPVRLKSLSSMRRLHCAARSTSGFKNLASKIEFKEVPDDHEYRDNGNEMIYIKNSKSYRNAIRAINIFESSRAPHSLNAHVEYWEFFERSGIPIFMSDTRYERWIDGMRIGIYGEDQMLQLKRRLKQYKNSGLPFIWFSQIPFVLQNGGDDNFSHYEEDQHDLIEYIVDCNIKNIFILTGDSHASTSARFKIYKNDQDTGCTIVEIMSSGIYQLSHDKPKSFTNTLVAGEYTLKTDESLEEVQNSIISKDNFCVVHANTDEKTIEATFFESNGKMIRKDTYDF